MITEIIEYKLKETAGEKEFLDEARESLKFFKTTFKGLIDLECMQGIDGWVTIMYWESMEDIETCAVLLQTNPPELADYYSLADKTSMKVTFLEQKIVVR